VSGVGRALLHRVGRGDHGLADHGERVLFSEYGDLCCQQISTPLGDVT
jgi:hypothetical protein